jgi:hypothetical protein
MPRFEITGGNGRNASFVAIRAAVKQAGGRYVSARHAHGMRNQPYVCTFGAADDAAARDVCRKACAILWPGDESILANLIAHHYRA